MYVIHTHIYILFSFLCSILNILLFNIFIFLYNKILYFFLYYILNILLFIIFFLYNKYYKHYILNIFIKKKNNFYNKLFFLLYKHS